MDKKIKMKDIGKIKEATYFLLSEGVLTSSEQDKINYRIRKRVEKEHPDYRRKKKVRSMT